PGDRVHERRPGTLWVKQDVDRCDEADAEPESRDVGDRGDDRAAGPAVGDPRPTPVHRERDEHRNHGERAVAAEREGAVRRSVVLGPDREARDDEAPYEPGDEAHAQMLASVSYRVGEGVGVRMPLGSGSAVRTGLGATVAGAVIDGVIRSLMCLVLSSYPLSTDPFAGNS